MACGLKIVALLTVLCGVPEALGQRRPFPVKCHPSGQVPPSSIPEEAPLVSRHDCNGFYYEPLLSKMELVLEREFSEMNVDTKNRIERMTNQILEKLETEMSDIRQFMRAVEVSFPTVNKDLSQTTNTVTPRSCKNSTLKVNGKTMLQIGTDGKINEVYCEQEKFGGGWLVIQRRFDASVDFSRNWNDYKHGFGSVDGELWLGLEKLHQLTKDRRYELIVEVVQNGTAQFARYDEFAIGSEEEKYALKKLGTFTGTALDSLSNQKGRPFSTKDRHNDPCWYHLAQIFEGAWWYHTCQVYNMDLNLPQYKSSFCWAGYSCGEPIKSTRMMIQELSSNIK